MLKVKVGLPGLVCAHSALQLLRGDGGSRRRRSGSAVWLKPHSL